MIEPKRVRDVARPPHAVAADYIAKSGDLRQL